MVTVGVDGAETRRVYKISYASTTNYGRSCGLTNSNSAWTDNRTWKLSGESTYSYNIAMTSCEDKGYVVLSYTSINIHSIEVDNSAFIILIPVVYAISSHSGS